MRTNTSLGIYFENDRVDLVGVRRSFKRFFVKDDISVSIPRGKEEQEEIFGRLKDFIHKVKGAKCPVNLGLPRRDTILLSLEFPFPAEENLRDVVGYELDRQTPYPKEDVYFDFKIMARDEEKKHIRVLIFVVLKVQMNRCLEILSKLGIRPNSVEISSIALMRVFLFGMENSTESRVLILHRGEETYDVVMVENGMFYYSRSFPEDQSGELALFSDEIERILANKGWSHGSVKEIVLAGGGEDEDNKIFQELAEKMDCKVSFVDQGYKRHNGQSLPPHLLISVGLALRGFEKGASLVNLLPSDRKKKKPKTYWVASLLSLVILLLGAGFLVAPITKGESVLKDISGRVDRLQIEMELLKKKESEVGVLERRVAQLKLIQETPATKSSQAVFLPLVKALTEMLPESTWLTDLQYKKGEIRIIGYSDSASALIPLLERSAFFSKVSFSAPTTIEEGKKRNNNDRNGFSISSLPIKDSKGLNAAVKGLERFKIKAILGKKQ